MKLIILIESQSEAMDSLFAVGPNDLRNHFLPEWLGIRPEDVKQIHFEELQRDGKVLSLKDTLLSSEPYEVRVHKENFPKKS